MTTRRPRLRRQSAVSDPAKPEPMIATSAFTKVSWLTIRGPGLGALGSSSSAASRTLCERDGRQLTLLEVHRLQTSLSGFEAGRAVGKTLKIPYVDEYSRGSG